MKPIRICRTHNGLMREAPLYEKWCDKVNAVAYEQCDPVAMVWSGDGHALLEVVECDDTFHVTPSFDSPEDCPSCGGSGLLYAARIVKGKSRSERKASGYDEGWSDALDATGADVVAVVPVKPLDKEG